MLPPRHPGLQHRAEVPGRARAIISSSRGTDARYEITRSNSPAHARRAGDHRLEAMDYLGNRGRVSGAKQRRSRSASSRRHRGPHADDPRAVPRTGRRCRRRIDRRPQLSPAIWRAKSEVRTFRLDGRRSAPRRPGSAASPAFAATRAAARPSTASPASTARARSSATTARQGAARSSPSRAWPSIRPATRSARSSTIRRTGRGCRCSWSSAAT